MTLRFLVIITLVSAISLGKEISVRAETIVKPESLEQVSPKLAQAMSAEDYSKRGNYKYESGDKQGAITDWKVVIRINPNFALDSSLPRKTERNLHEYREDDIFHWNEVISERFSDHTLAYSKRGLAKYKLGDKQGAIADYKQAIGLAKYELGDKQGAIASWSEAVRTNPNFAQAYYHRGLAQLELGYYDEAISDFNEAIRLNFNYADAYEARGRLKRGLGDNQGSITDYNAAKLIGITDVYINGGIAGLVVINTCDEAIRIDSKNFRAWYTRGLVTMSLGYKLEKNAAIADFTEAIRLNSKYADAYHARGILKYELGNQQGALEDYNNAISSNSNFAKAYYSRGLIYKEKGDKEKALADFRKVLELCQRQGNIQRCNESLDGIKELGG